jgi:hypothetical protein
MKSPNHALVANSSSRSSPSASTCNPRLPPAPAVRKHSLSLRRSTAMKSLTLTILALMLTGCVTYRISPKAKPLRVEPDASLRIIKLNERPEGFQCFEPMLWFVTAGVIPVQCVDTYSVAHVTAVEPIPGAVYTVTSIGGWAALFLAPFPSWHFGNPKNVEAEIEHVVRKANQ